MIVVPPIDPVAFAIGPLQVHWYGLMYLIGFVSAWWLGRYRMSQPFRGFDPAQMDDLLFFCALGTILGGRIGYTLFYATDRLIEEPLFLFKIWQGGMSFHGGLLGALVASAVFAQRHNRRFWEVADLAAPLVPIGLCAGRIGNFINANLWGAPTQLPWGMVFIGNPAAGGIPRHPTQLYEALLEGVALFVILWWFSARPRPLMAVSGVFMLGYGCFRFAVEFIRIPDRHIGYLAFDWLTLGQVLTLPMLICGVILLWLSRRQPLPVR